MTRVSNDARGLVDGLVRHRDGDADALRGGRELVQVDLGVAQGDAFAGDGGLDGLVDGPDVVAGQAGRQGEAHLVEDEALDERLDEVLDAQGDDATFGSVGHHHAGELARTHERDLGLPAGLEVLADELLGFRVGVRVLAEIVGGGRLHPHAQELVLAGQGLELLGLGLVALTLLRLARIGDLVDARAVRLVLLHQFANVDLVFLHVQEKLGVKQKLYRWQRGAFRAAAF